MSAQVFDPVDLAMLAAGWQCAQREAANALGFDGLRIDDATALIVAAEILHELWLEYSDRWCSVWPYEVAEPLGAAIAVNGIIDEPDEIRRVAVEIIEKAIASEVAA